MITAKTKLIDRRREPWTLDFRCRNGLICVSRDFDGARLMVSAERYRAYFAEVQ